MADSKDSDHKAREAIMARRQFFITSALAGVALSACDSTNPRVCLKIEAPGPSAAAPSASTTPSSSASSNPDAPAPIVPAPTAPAPTAPTPNPQACLRISNPIE